MGLLQESALVIEEIESQFEANPTLSLMRLRELKTEEALDQLLFEDDTFSADTAAGIAIFSAKLDPKLEPH